MLGLPVATKHPMALVAAGHHPRSSVRPFHSSPPQADSQSALNVLAPIVSHASPQWALDTLLNELITIPQTLCEALWIHEKHHRNAITYYHNIYYIIRAAFLFKSPDPLYYRSGIIVTGGWFGLYWMSYDFDIKRQKTTLCKPHRIFKVYF